MNKIKVGLGLLVIAVSSSSYAAYSDSNFERFYIGMDVEAIEGEVSGKKSFIPNSKLNNYGGTIGYNLNKTFSTDMFYAESDEYEVKNYGIRLNARPQIYQNMYGVASVGLVQTEFDAKGKYNLNEDLDNPKIEDKTNIEEYLAAGLGYKFDVFAVELKYIKKGEQDGFGGAFHVSF